MLDGTLFVVCLLENSLFLLFSGILTCNCNSRNYLVAVYPVYRPSTPYCFFSPAENAPLTFALQNIDHTFVPTWKPLNVLDGSLFFVCLLVNMLFLLFSGILTSICIRRTYLVAVYTLNTPSTPYCLFLTAENVPLTFGVVLWPSKHRPYLCSNLQTSKYGRRCLVGCLFACKDVISAVFRHFKL